MKRKILILFINLLAISFLFGCGQQAENNVKDKIQFVPNENYVGDPHPVVKEEMKLTDEEHKEFEELQRRILSEKEGE